MTNPAILSGIIAQIDYLWLSKSISLTVIEIKSEKQVRNGFSFYFTSYFRT